MSTPVTALVPLGSRPLHERVAAVVRGEMAKRRISQASAAAALGIVQQSINRKIRGITPFSIDELDTLAELIYMTPDAIVAAATDLAADGSGPVRLPHLDSNQEPSGYPTRLLALRHDQAGPTRLATVTHLPRRRA